MTYRIPFNRPCLAGNEYKYIAEAIANGHASGDGPFTRKCHELLERELGVQRVLLTTSCTHALEMAALLLGCLATQSFHETKNFTCGEGGALIVNDAELLERALVIREKGTNRSRFFRGEVDKYTWVDLGSSYLPSDLLAAFLYAQLEAREKIQEKRRHVWNRYYKSLADWAESNDVKLPVIPPECEQAYHMFYLILPSVEDRESLISQLKAKSILSVFHYPPLHLSEAGQKFAAGLSNCPVTEEISERLLRLPFYNDLSESEQDQVTGAVTNSRFRSLSRHAC